MTIVESMPAPTDRADEWMSEWNELDKNTNAVRCAPHVGHVCVCVRLCRKIVEKNNVRKKRNGVEQNTTAQQITILISHPGEQCQISLLCISQLRARVRSFVRSYTQWAKRVYSVHVLRCVQSNGKHKINFRNTKWFAVTIGAAFFPELKT